MFWSVVAARVSGCGVCTVCCAACSRMLHSTQCTHQMLPQYCITYNDVFYVWDSVHHKTILYKGPTRCNLTVCLLVTARLLYMFRTLSASIIRSTKIVLAATSACHASGCYISCEDVQGRLPLHYVIVYLGYISSRPMTRTSGCSYSFSTPDAGRRKRPKHIE
jgi:hypothetical protein